MPSIRKAWHPLTAWVTAMPTAGCVTPFLEVQGDMNELLTNAITMYSASENWLQVIQPQDAPRPSSGRRAVSSVKRSRLVGNSPHDKQDGRSLTVSCTPTLDLECCAP
jgi:hypothetical protein